ncbi:daunorubicin resistance protein DrrA family ABC transporter ATP-binding protein [Saccharothrix syringae]|uniref:Daunorubicin resistance protein DrrA family ABC transporter ATP-binding protein n=1 Tax=Saccharothrix syringae TaxID=103733 RepID=A0A5Q0HEU2_SACSY|nr:daunorubicin resistance protein DrrA family ABC transporter ATP-binding protein [Saccharothrix syringae]QFZ24619.1 daunorubicin resistance protein DrrA family ABC transporter ATP-binding protein [Saccharothrix syringae]
MIEASGLRKTYRGRGRRAEAVEAVRGVDFAVRAGEIFGFLGPNGAGKSTTLRMLATLVRPDGGRATIGGADLLRAPARVRDAIGFVAQSSGTYDDATGRQELVVQARMHGRGKAEALRLAQEAVESFDLAEFADRRIKTYSGGQRRRLDFAIGVIHRPGVMFLDEPTAGLDPQSRARMWREVRRLRDNGMTIFLTTHYLDEADALCDRISIIDRGLIVAEGTPADLKREISGDVVTVDLAAPGTAGLVDGATTEAAVAVLTGQPFVHGVEAVGTTLRLYVDGAATAVPPIIGALLRAGVRAGAIESRRPSLDDVFLAKTGRSLRD